MQNIDEPKRANTEGDISVYEEVVRDTAIDNDGIYEESLPSSAHNNDNRRLSGKLSEYFNLVGRVVSACVFYFCNLGLLFLQHAVVLPQLCLLNAQ